MRAFNQKHVTVHTFRYFLTSQKEDEPRYDSNDFLKDWPKFKLKFKKFICGSNIRLGNLLNFLTKYEGHNAYRCMLLIKKACALVGQVLGRQK